MKKSSTSLQDLARRIKQLETEVGDLRRMVAERPAANGIDPQWWRTEAGRFKDDPTFEEAVRLGRQYRKSVDRKKPKKAKTAR